MRRKRASEINTYMLHNESVRAQKQGKWVMCDAKGDGQMVNDGCERSP
jgi:hypothetical protein